MIDERFHVLNLGYLLLLFLLLYVYLVLMKLLLLLVVGGVFLLRGMDGVWRVGMGHRSVGPGGGGMWACLWGVRPGRGCVWSRGRSAVAPVVRFVVIRMTCLKIKGNSE